MFQSNSTQHFKMVHVYTWALVHEKKFLEIEGFCFQVLLLKHQLFIWFNLWPFRYQGKIGGKILYLFIIYFTLYFIGVNNKITNISNCVYVYFLFNWEKKNQGPFECIINRIWNLRTSALWEITSCIFTIRLSDFILRLYSHHLSIFFVLKIAFHGLNYSHFLISLDPYYKWSFDISSYNNSIMTDDVSDSDWSLRVPLVKLLHFLNIFIFAFGW